MAKEHETVVAFCVESKARDDIEASLVDGPDAWFLWARYGAAIDLAREAMATLRRNGREARIIKTTTTTTREVVDE